MHTADREKPLPHNVCSFTSSLCACPAISASIECIFSTYGLIWSNIRNSLDAEKAENWLKYTDFTELKKIPSRIYSHCSNHSSLFFKSFKFNCCSFYSIKKKSKLDVQVCCLFYFLLHSRFFKGKVKSRFFGGFYWFLVGFFWKQASGFFWVGSNYINPVSYNIA